MSALRTLATTLLALSAIRLLPIACQPHAMTSNQPPSERETQTQWNIPDRPPIPGVEHGVLRSASMKRDVGYNVYTPVGYAESKRRYPVVYFLHGAGGTENSDAGGFSRLLQQEIEAKRIPPVLCVFPNGGMSGYADRPEANVMGETLIVKELIPLIDSRYRTVKHRDGRAVCGFSMGGGGAIRLALKHPNLFSAAASWAGALNAFRGATDASLLAKENARRARGKVRFLLIVGEKDFTYASHPPFLTALDELNIPYVFRKLVGVDHNLGAYYEQTGQEFADFIAAFPGKAK